MLISAVDLTLLLTIVAFKQVLAGTIPPISYLTRLDVYALLALLLLGARSSIVVQGVKKGVPYPYQ